MRGMTTGMMLLGTVTLAACNPTPSNYSYGFTSGGGGPGPNTSVGPGPAPTPSGFAGSTRFFCGGSLVLDITGSGSSISVAATGLPPFTATGGPLVYQSAGGDIIAFQPGFASLDFSNPGRNIRPEPCRA